MIDASYVMPCLHQFCYTCILQWAESKPECPLCNLYYYQCLVHCYPNLCCFLPLLLVLSLLFPHVSPRALQTLGSASWEMGCSKAEAARSSTR
uniref:RING-type domain-containing protein n=1 Tax=Amazona collaria TaxID=241587 RepID=A0A8B9FZH8_9PSIT